MLRKKIAGICLFILFACSTQAQQINYTNSTDNWNADSLGNHRAVVHFNGTGKVAKVIIEWRRRDNDPKKKRIIIEDGQTKKRILNVTARNISRESGEVYFEPTSGKGIYYVYYLTYKNEGRNNYPRGVYLKPDTTASAEWLKLFSISSFKPNAYCNEIQAINAFNSFYPMEVIATANETKQLQEKYQHEIFLVFPEDRINAIRMKDDLPQRWIQKGPSNIFTGDADKDENYTFQLGIYALQDVQNVQVVFSDLTGADNNKIPEKNISCINTDGINYDGKILKNKVDVAAGKIQALWCALKIPATIPAGIYKGLAKVSVEGSPVKIIGIAITVSDTIAVNAGVNEPGKMTRLGWLNSLMAQDNTVIAPYTPLQVNGNIISLLGRKLEVNDDGFPKQIQTFFTEEMTGYASQPNNELAEPVHFHFRNPEGKDMQWTHSGIQYRNREPFDGNLSAQMIPCKWKYLLRWSLMGLFHTVSK
jgi:Family of unknown function (DUF6067)